jgi:hypothetical protein
MPLPREVEDFPRKTAYLQSGIYYAPACYVTPACQAHFPSWKVGVLLRRLGDLRKAKICEDLEACHKTNTCVNAWELEDTPDRVRSDCSLTQLLHTDMLHAVCRRSPLHEVAATCQHLIGMKLLSDIA